MPRMHRHSRDGQAACKHASALQRMHTLLRAPWCSCPYAHCGARNIHTDLEQLNAAAALRTSATTTGPPPPPGRSEVMSSSSSTQVRSTEASASLLDLLHKTQRNKSDCLCSDLTCCTYIHCTILQQNGTVASAETTQQIQMHTHVVAAHDDAARVGCRHHLQGNRVQRAALAEHKL